MQGRLTSHSFTRTLFDDTRFFQASLCLSQIHHFHPPPCACTLIGALEFSLFSLKERAKLGVVCVATATPAGLARRRLRREIAIDSRRVHILQTHCSKGKHLETHKIKLIPSASASPSPSSPFFSSSSSLFFRSPLPKQQHGPRFPPENTLSPAQRTF